MCIPIFVNSDFMKAVNINIPILPKLIFVRRYFFDLDICTMMGGGDGAETGEDCVPVCGTTDVGCMMNGVATGNGK